MIGSQYTKSIASLICAAAILACTYGISLAQSPDSSLAGNKIPGDTLLTDAGTDSLDSGENFSSIEYEADSSRMSGRTVTLFGTQEKLAKVSYQDMIIEAMKITHFFDGDSLVAEGFTVPANKDSFPDGFRIVGKPVLTQAGQEPITGLKMIYNLQSQRARVFEGRTKFEGGFYYGQNIVRLNEEFLQIRDGYYTTCDKEGPHFHFRSSSMKLHIKSKVIARPVIFYIYDVPVFLLPFGFFPIHGGRNSGFIMPTYGESKVEGRYLQGIGYYFAPNDYVDAKVLMDYYDKAGVMFRGDMRYSVRYKMSGNISGSITRKSYTSRDFLGRVFGTSEVRQWDLRVSHSQRISPTMNLSVSGAFVSDGSFNKRFTRNRDARTQRRIFSSANLNKRWEGSKNSMTISVSRSQDLSTDVVSEVLPSITFNRSTPTYLFRGEDESLGAGTRRKRFYSDFNFRYNSQLKNLRSKFISGTVMDTVVTIDPETAEPDTVPTQRNLFARRTRSGAQHNLSFSMPMRVFKHLSVSSSANYKEEWLNERDIKHIDEEGRTVTETENGFFARRTGNVSVGINTKLFGMFNPNIGSLRTIRHVFTPSVSFSYRPDFSDPSFGYFATYTDTTGKEIEYDRFGTSLFGGTSRGTSRSMSVSMQHLFQARTVKDDVENKFDIMNISMSTSYNFAAPQGVNRLSDLASNYRILKFGSFNFSTRHSFYTFDPVAKRTTNAFVIDAKNGLSKLNFLRLTNLSASTSFRFSGGEPGQNGQGTQITPDESRAFNDELVVNRAADDNQQERFEDRNIFEQQSVPWTFRGSLRFSINRRDPTRVRKLISSRANLDIQVTENWRVGYSGNFNLVKRSVNYQDINIYRNLHCWEFNFSWTPPGSSRAGFWLEIRIKESKLRDIRIKKTDYGGSALGRLR